MRNRRSEIAEEMLARASKMWGPERAEALRSPIEDMAASIEMVGRSSLGLDGDEPDFLVARAGAPELR